MALTEGMRMSSEAVTEAAVKERLPCEEATAPVAADEDAELVSHLEPEAYMPHSVRCSAPSMLIRGQAAYSLVMR